ncbi:hypothetical protein OAS07_06435 [Candidatus Thioglobus sp.]|nr:hypothetical protein [Candidatus Thioglobus sp.]MDC0904200.1 hypothetical protein [Candidatus Thioglobus sp.]MDC0966001.1 hypothetical protein [Candidatus Thioglobus sp.]MDC1165740.1 hypothetical protein [Candidatus Thioglobus sp.]
MDKINNIALKIKVSAEIVIATVAFFVIVLALFDISLGALLGKTNLGLINHIHPLKTAAFALALAASIDLLFLLFSPSIKEGMNALLLGFVSAILMTISEPKIVGWEIALTVLVFTFCMLAIWLAKEKLPGGEDNQKI